MILEDAEGGGREGGRKEELRILAPSDGRLSRLQCDAPATLADTSNGTRGGGEGEQLGEAFATLQVSYSPTTDPWMPLLLSEWILLRIIWNPDD